MAYVVIIFGASGAGKSTLMEVLAAAGGQYSIQVIATTRPAREYDGVEISCVQEITTADYEYIFEIYGFRYGVQRRQIEDALERKQHHFMVCSDIDVIRQIKRDYGARAKAVFQYLDAPRETVAEILRSRKLSDNEIQQRLAKMDILYTAFVEELELFDGTLLNRFSEPVSVLRQRMERLLLKFGTS
jgi:guanylate kinase